MKNRKRALILAGTAAALVATLIGAAPAPAAPVAPKTASVHGEGQVFYAYSPDDEIRFTFHAESAPFSNPIALPGGEKGMPTDAGGVVIVHHRVAKTGVTGTSTARVDCLVTGGRTATLTALVETSDVGWKENRRIGISIEDGTGGQPDRVGFTWDLVNIDEQPDGKVAQPTVGSCMAPAPFAPAVKGGFKVTPAPLPPLPKS